MKTITQIRKEAKQEKEERETWRTQGDLEIVKCFLYNEGSILQIHVYDKRTKRMFAGAIHTSSYSRKEMLELDNPSSNYIKEKEQIK